MWSWESWGETQCDPVCPEALGQVIAVKNVNELSQLFLEEGEAEQTINPSVCDFLEISRCGFHFFK